MRTGSFGVARVLSFHRARGGGIGTGVVLAVALLMLAVAGAWGAEVAGLTVDVGADAGVVRPLLGINTGPYMAASGTAVHVLGPYKELGVTQVRTHDFYGPVDMYEMYPDESADPASSNSFVFGRSDARMEYIHDNGHEIFLRLGNSYNYGEPGHSAPPPANVTNWIAAAANVIRHYTEGLWGGSYYPVRYVEIWNEPDNPQFWGGSQAAFFSFFAQAATTLKAQFPDLRIGGPGFVPASCLMPTSYAPQFLAYCRSNSVPLDFLSWHIYSDAPEDYARAAAYYRTLLDTNGYTNAESCVSEWHVETGALRNNAEGAAVLTAAWIALQDAGVELSEFYRGQDPNSGMDTFYGLLRADGSWKTPAYAFKAWYRFARHTRRLAVTGADGHAGFAAIAGRTEAGDSLAVMFARHGTGTVTACRMTFTNVTGHASWIARRYLVSPTNNLDLVEQTAVDLATPIEHAVPGNTVELLVLTAADAPAAPQIVDTWTASSASGVWRLLAAGAGPATNLAAFQLPSGWTSAFVRVVAPSNAADKVGLQFARTLSAGGIWDDPAAGTAAPLMVLVPGGAQPTGPAYDFHMGRTEVQNVEFVQFLNDAETFPASPRGTNVVVNRTGAAAEWGDAYMSLAKAADQRLFDISMSRLEYDADQPVGQRYRVTPASPAGGGSYSNHPVVGVTWFGAAKYCNWLTVTRGGADAMRCYHEGSSPAAWYPITLSSGSDFTNAFGAAARETWRTTAQVRLGFRLPMTGLCPAGNAYNEFFRAAAWDGVANTRYAWGRNALTNTDANWASSGDPFDGDTTPAGFYDGMQAHGGGSNTATNENRARIYDLGGNVEEWGNDPWPAASGYRRVFGGHYGSDTNALDLFAWTNALPAEATATRGFRIVTGAAR